MFLCVSTQLESFLSHKKLEKSFKLLVFVLEYGQFRPVYGQFSLAHCLLLFPAASLPLKINLSYRYRSTLAAIAIAVKSTQTLDGW